MIPQQLEDRQLETRVTALEAELSQVKKLLSSFPQTETVKHNWMKYAGVFKNDVDFLEIMQEIRAERDLDDESEVDPSYYS
jgi:tetrahydromethanopterin S-methyltransferase subunit B